MSTTVFDLQAILGIDTSGFENGLKNAAKFGVAALGAASAAMVKFGADSVQTGAEFDKSMSQVAATMGKTTEEIQDLRDFAQEMGRTTAFSATQSADALNYMALAGYDAETSMSMLPNVLNLAAAGSMDLARASDMVTDTQTAFGISLERTTQLVDEMAKAASTGNTSVEQLGDAFLTIGGLAQELNGGMVQLDDGTEVAVDGVQELEIALTAMANAGIKGSEAGTHMRNILTKLSDPSSEGTKALQAMGVAVFDTAGNMRSLNDIFSDLNDSMSTMTQEQKIQTITALFNARDLSSAEALLNAVSQDWDSIGASILDAEGAASKMAETQLDNLAGDVTLFKSALEGAQIAVSDVLTPSLREFVQFGTDGLSRLTAAFQEGGLTEAMNVFGDILADGLSMIISKVPEFIDAGMQLLGALGKGLMDNVDVILFAIGDVMQLVLNKALEASQSSGGQIFEIISWILGVFEENYMQFIDIGMQIITNIFNGLTEGLTENLPDIIYYATEMLKYFVNAIIKNLPMLLKAGLQMILALAQGIVNALPEIIKTIIELLPEILQMVVDTLIELLPMLIDGMIQLVIAIVEALPEIITALVDALPTIITTLIDAFITLMPMIIEGLVRLVVEIVAHLPEIIAALIQAIPVVVMTIINAFAQFFGWIINSYKDLFAQIGQALKEWGAQKKEDISNWWSDFIASIKQWFAELPYNLGYMIADLWLKVEEFNRQVWEWITTKLPEIIEGICEWWNSLPGRIWDFLLQIVANLVEWTSEMVSKAQKEVPKIIDGIAKFFEELPGKAIQWGKDMIQGFIDGVKAMAQQAWDAISDFAQGVADRIGFSEPKLGPLSNFHTYAPDMIDLFTQGIKENQDLLYQAVEDAFDFKNIIVSPSIDDIDANGYGTGTVNTFNITITQPVDSPSDIARALREELQYGLLRNEAYA